MLEHDKMLSGGNSVIKIVSTSGMLEAGGQGVLKVRKVQMLLHCPKYEQKYFEKFFSKYSGQNFSNFTFIFWAMPQLHTFIVKFTDL